jgi:hypothetical protein
LIEASVHPERVATLTQRLGDWPLWPAAFAVVFVTLERRKAHA